ncbi:MAG: hypothetical protein ACLQM8_08355 [Limisphaerales bacterium]
MNTPGTPSVTIEHELPGRLRVRLSHGVRDVPQLHRMLLEHPGVTQSRYAAITSSLLVLYQPGVVSAEEIVVRVAIALSLEQHLAVRVLSRPRAREVTDSGFYAGVCVLAALAARVPRPYRVFVPALDWLAGLATAGSVLEHGWLEYRRRGNFDPEVLMVTYLLTAMLRGNVLPAALFTWIATFGRHLTRLPAAGVEVRPTEIARKGNQRQVEVLVVPEHAPRDKMAFFGLIPAMVMHALTGTGPAPHPSLIDGIKHVAQVHNQVLEGIGGFAQGIPLRIRYTHSGRRSLPNAERLT